MGYLTQRRLGDRIEVYLAGLVGDELGGECVAVIQMVRGRTRDEWLRRGQMLHLETQRERAGLEAGAVLRERCDHYRAALRSIVDQGPDSDRAYDLARHALDSADVRTAPGDLGRIRDYAEAVLSDCLVELRAFREDLDDERDSAVLAEALGDYDLGVARALADHAIELHTPTVRQGL